MASSAAHRAMGIPCGVAAAALVWDYGLGHAVLAAVFGWMGSMAPDRLEEKWWSSDFKRYLAHRGWTHILALWLGGLYAGWWFMWDWWGSALFGFAIGGLSHLIADAPNKPGIPLVWRTGRLNLGLWKSGTADWLFLTLAWVFAGWAVDGRLLDGWLAQWVVWGWELALAAWRGGGG